MTTSVEIPNRFVGHILFRKEYGEIDNEDGSITKAEGLRFKVLEQLAEVKITIPDAQRGCASRRVIIDKGTPYTRSLVKQQILEDIEESKDYFAKKKAKKEFAKKQARIARVNAYSAEIGKKKTAEKSKKPISKFAALDVETSEDSEHEEPVEPQRMSKQKKKKISVTIALNGEQYSSSTKNPVIQSYGNALTTKSVDRSADWFIDQSKEAWPGISPSKSNTPSKPIWVENTTTLKRQNGVVPETDNNPVYASNTIDTSKWWN